MENKGNTMIKSSMTYGLMLGIALVVFSLITYMIGIVKPPFWVSAITYVIIIAGIVYGIKKYRDEDLGGEITYGKALGFGILICVFAAVISSIYTLLLTTVIDPEYMNKIMAATEQDLINKGMPEEQIEMTMEMSKKFTTPAMTTIFGLLGMGIIGAIFSAIIAIFMKKEKPLFEQKPE